MKNFLTFVFIALIMIGLHITPTRIDVLDSAPAPAARELDDARTSIKPILVIPQSPSLPASGLVTQRYFYRGSHRLQNSDLEF